MEFREAAIFFPKLEISWQARSTIVTKDKCQSSNALKQQTTTQPIAAWWRKMVKTESGHYPRSPRFLPFLHSLVVVLISICPFLNHTSSFLCASRLLSTLRADKSVDSRKVSHFLVRPPCFLPFLHSFLIFDHRFTVMLNIRICWALVASYSTFQLWNKALPFSSGLLGAQESLHSDGFCASSHSKRVPDCATVQGHSDHPPQRGERCLGSLVIPTGSSTLPQSTISCYLRFLRCLCFAKPR